MESLNQELFGFFFKLTHQNPLLDIAIIFFAKYLPYLLAAGFLVFVFSKNDWRMRAFLLGEAVLAVLIARGIITEAIRFFYHHARPFIALNLAPLVDASGNSFPSGHVTLFFALSTIIFYSDQKLGGWYFALAAIIGIARIFAGVHWPLDVVGGAIVGIVMGVIVRKLTEPYSNSLALKENSAL